MNLRFFRLSSCLFACAVLALGSCGNKESDDENASMVNVEKGVAPALWAPEGENAVPGEMPSQQEMSATETEAPVEEEPQQAVVDQTPQEAPAPQQPEEPTQSEE